jgi:hypothetical protein
MSLLYRRRRIKAGRGDRINGKIVALGKLFGGHETINVLSSPAQSGVR